MINTTLSPWVRHLNTFQQLSLVNRGVTDLVGVDLPLVVLANNNNERKERLFRQAMIFAIVFCLAPIHSKIYSEEIAKKFLNKAMRDELKSIRQSPGTMLKLSFKSMKTLPEFQSGMRSLFENEFKHPVPKAFENHLTEDFRRKMVLAKTLFLMADLATEGAFFTSLGWIKNLFSKLFVTHSNQFSGEVGVIDQKKLDALYKKEDPHERLSQKTKAVLSSLFGIAAPVLLVLALQQSLLKPGLKTPIANFFRNISHHFDYRYASDFKFIRNVPFMALVPYAFVGYLNSLTDIANSRSPREALENTIKISIDCMLVFGDKLWIRLLSPFRRHKKSIPMNCRTSIQKTKDYVEQAIREGRLKPINPEQFIRQRTRETAWLYLAGFGLNLLSTAGIISLMNWSARKKVKLDAAHHLGQQPPATSAAKPALSAIKSHGSNVNAFSAAMTQFEMMKSGALHCSRIPIA